MPTRNTPQSAPSATVPNVSQIAVPVAPNRSDFSAGKSGDRKFRRALNKHGKRMKDIAKQQKRLSKGIARQNPANVAARQSALSDAVGVIGDLGGSLIGGLVPGIGSGGDAGDSAGPTSIMAGKPTVGATSTTVDDTTDPNTMYYAAGAAVAALGLAALVLKR